MELSSQFSGLTVGGGSNGNLSAGSRLKSKRSQRFTVPVQLPNPAASPPFSNSTSEESGPTAGTTGSSSSFSLSNNTASSTDHYNQQQQQHFLASNNNNASYPALFPPPPSNFAQTQQTTPTNTATSLMNGGSNGNTLLNGSNGQFEHAFLQQDPFAYPSASSSQNNNGRSRTLSSGSSSNNSQHHQHNHHQHHQSTGSLSANGIWADLPASQSQPHQMQQHQQRNSGPFEAFNGNLARNGSPFNHQHQQAPFQQQQQNQQPNLRQQFINGQGNAGGSNGSNNAQPQAAAGPDDVIPTAIVIKNIPFNFPSTSLLQIIEELTLAPPYAFNYHYDMSVFRGLAFANFHTPQETDACVAALNGFEIQGRKLRVEYKKVLQAGEKERIERDKAIKRMRSMQLDRERMIQQQQAHVHHLQQQIFGQQGQPGVPPHMQQQQQQQQQDFQQQQHPMHLNNIQMNMAPGHQHQHSNDDFEDYGRAVHPSNSMFNQPNGQMNIAGTNAFSPPMEGGDSYPSQTSGGSGASSTSRTGSGSSMPTELDMNDSQTLELYSRVLLFKEDALRDELAFSKALSNVQRRIVHLIAQKLNLDHRSAGSGDERYVVVSKPGSNSGSNNGVQQQQQQQPQQQQRSLRTRASAYPMLNPDPYAPPQPSLLPDGVNMQGFNNAMRKKSMPDLRHQPQHPLYGNPQYQQYPAQSGNYSHQQHQQQQHSIGNNAQANITPRHSTHDLRAVAASATTRRSMHFHTSAPGENDSIPPVPALPANLLQQNNSNLPSNAIMNSIPHSAPPNGSNGSNSNGSNASGSDRHSIIFGSGSVDLDHTSIPKSANSLNASTLSMDSKIVGSPVKSDPSSAANANGVLRQPRGPDNATSWTRAAAIAASGSL